MFNTLEEVNAHITERTAGLIKVPVVDEPDDRQYGTTVQLFAKDPTDGPILEYTTYDPGTAIDSEHASLIDEAPDMVKVLFGNPDDITSIRVIEFDLADGVDATELPQKILDEADHAASAEKLGDYETVSQHGIAVEDFAKEVLAVDPDAGLKLTDVHSGMGQIAGQVDLRESPAYQNRQGGSHFANPDEVL